MNKLTKEKCKNCRYFAEPDGVRPNDMTGQKKSCYLAPPTTTLIPGPPDMAGNPSIQVICVRPSVDPDDFCASFEARFDVVKDSPLQC